MTVSRECSAAALQAVQPGLVSLLVDLEAVDGDMAAAGDLATAAGLNTVFCVTNFVGGGQTSGGLQLMSRLFATTTCAVVPPHRTRLVFNLKAGCELSPGQELGRAVTFNPAAA